MPTVLVVFSFTSYRIALGRRKSKKKKKTVPFVAFESKTLFISKNHFFLQIDSLKISLIMSKYVQSGGSLFEDDVDDDEFLRNARPGAALQDDRTQSILQKKREIEERTLQSTENSLSKKLSNSLFLIPVNIELYIFSRNA